jgi:hypothetical protein
MMKFIDERQVNASKPLKNSHFPFPRAKALSKAVTSCMTDYYTKAQIGKSFEARGILVVGKSRQGKSREIQHILNRFNDGSVIMPDGRSAKFVACVLSGMVTWKDMGLKTLQALGYELKPRHTQAQIWDQVVKIAQMQGVVGIHFDECQHVFSEKGDRTNQQILDSFKALLKDTRWPLMLILSGIPSLANQVASEEQLSRLLQTVHFSDIDITQRSDIDEILQLTFSFAEKVGLDFSPLANIDFLDRLVFSCSERWGLVIELLIKAFTICQLADQKVCSVEHFSEAYSEIYSTPPGYTPFNMPNYRENFDPDKILKILEAAS